MHAATNRAESPPEVSFGGLTPSLWLKSLHRKAAADQLVLLRALDIRPKPVPLQQDSLHHGKAGLACLAEAVRRWAFVRF